MQAKMDVSAIKLLTAAFLFFASDFDAGPRE